MKRILATVALAGLAIQPAQAGNPPTALNVLVEDIDNDSKACGITAPALEAAVTSAMRYNRIERSYNRGAAPRVYINVNTLYRAVVNLCTTNVSLRISYYQYSIVPAMDDKPFVESVICSTGGMQSSVGGGNFASGINTTVKDLFDKCLNDIVSLGDPN